MTGPDRDLQSERGLEPLLSIEEVADVLRISESGVYRLIRRGGLCCVKVGGRTLVEPLELRGFIATSRQVVAGSASEERAFDSDESETDGRKSGKAVVLVSGGLDSATALGIAKSQGLQPCAITFRYGQRHG